VSLSCSLRVLDRDVVADLEVGHGETVALLGPNGAGKSTLLSVVAGLLRPDEGHVVLEGRPLTRTGRRPTWVPPHDRQVALLAQEPLLFPHLSVLDNVAFGPRSRGSRRSDSRATARRWLEEVGIADLADRRPSQVSGGQAQRAAVARALATDPRLLLLDEPLAALDVSVAPVVRQTLRRVLRDRTAVVVTHDVLDALLLADRVVVLEGGRVVEDGVTSEVLSRPRSSFAARIAGLNLVAGTWQHDQVHSRSPFALGGVVVGPPPAPGDAVVAVFRPGAVSVHRERPGGSPRNVLPVTVTELHPLGDRVRVRAGELSADVTPAAVGELELVPGSPTHFVVKATEVEVYRR
jgi:molybdate transport system ATP-binding protein